MPLLFLIKSSYPIIDEYDFRNFDVHKLRPVVNNYLTYYDFEEVSSNDYPVKYINYIEVAYNKTQLDMLMRFADNGLNINELIKINKDYSLVQDAAYLQLHSSKTQERLKNTIGAGREIGNLTYYFKDKKQTVYPEKFAQIYALTQKSKGPIVVYSHYYHNGILIFAKYLKSKGQKNYAILHPDLPEDDYENIITKYNNGQIKFLLIHPEITEGISLKGTKQMHILETSVNKAAQDQIIGRAVRYKSHEHLPKKQRFVDIYIWKQIIPKFSLDHMLALRRNWYNNYPEVNYYTERIIIDKNTVFKTISPDQKSYLKMNTLNQVSHDMNHMLKKHSIEVKY